MQRSAFAPETLPGSDDGRIAWDRALAFTWAGMVVGISFLATPAKFLAPSLTLPVALDVGRHTFRTFGRVETGLGMLLGLRSAVPRRGRLLALAPCLIVLGQALWLRPRLDARARRVIEGGATPSSSNLHFAYVVCEAAKLAALLAFGVTPVQPRAMPAARELHQNGADGRLTGGQT